MDSDPTIARLQAALELHETGRLDEAEAAYRAVLAENPRQHDALHLLGVLMDQRDRPDEARDLIARAIGIAPQTAVFHLNLGNVLRRLGRADEATRAWRTAAALAPELAADAYANVASLCAETQAPAAVLANWRRVAQAAAQAQASPQDARAYAALALALDDAGDLRGAITTAAVACRIAPRDGEHHNLLGWLLLRDGRADDAVRVFRQAAALLPNDARVLVNLAGALGAGSSPDITEAVQLARRGTELAPNYHGGYEVLASLLREAGEPAGAAAAARQAIALQPAAAGAYESLGNALFDLGRAADAVAAFRRAVELNPARHEAYDNVLQVMHYAGQFDPRPVRDEHLRWAARYADPITERAMSDGPAHVNDRDPERRLRVGFVSPDLRRHPVATFFEPLLAHHDRDALEVVLYSNTRVPDDVTARLRAGAAAWRDIRALRDAEAARLVRDDRIDVLVDLAGHTAHNRLLLFAHVPAPVQATYIGYWNTTGMRAIDYRLTDAWCDPPGGPTEPWWVERLERIDGGAWCFAPPTDRPDVSESPAARDGVATFVSTNKLAKISDGTLALWRRVLERTRRARLIVVAGGDETRLRAALRGIDASRYEIMQRLPLAEYVRLYHRADVLLDALPHNGHATSVDSLWMGVPVLTLAGDVHCARLGASLLTAIGLESWISTTADEHVDHAVSLEDRADELAELRRGMRDRLRASPLTDGARLARGVERALRAMWRRWCAG